MLATYTHRYKRWLITALCCTGFCMTAQAKSLILVQPDGSIQVVNNLPNHTVVTAGQVKIVEGVTVFFDKPQISPPVSKDAPSVVVMTM